MSHNDNQWPYCIGNYLTFQDIVRNRKLHLAQIWVLERGKEGQRKLVTRQPAKINDWLAAAGCRVGIFLTAVELIGPMSSAYKLMKHSLHNYAHLLQRMNNGNRDRNTSKRFLFKFYDQLYN